MTRNIVFDCLEKETRVAILESGETVEVYVEKSESEGIVGNIYRGRIANVIPGIQAAFIDIGLGKNAFLFFGDLNSLQEAGLESESDYLKTLKVGNEITVQVIKEAFGSKGARLTTNITLPGRYLVLVPYGDQICVSRRIENLELREKLKTIAQEIVKEDVGVIIRTIAKDCEKKVFEKELKELLKKWKDIKKIASNSVAPARVYQDLGLISKSLRDLIDNNINSIIINDPKQYKDLVIALEKMDKDMAKKVVLYDKEYDIFKYYNIESAIRKSLAQKVWLKSGGYLVFDKTEALTVVDVNTGKFIGNKNLEDTVVKTNLEAAREIAKQLRLRDIGGIIIIDFIDMVNKGHRALILDELRVELKKDRTKSTVVGLTGLGLVEMTRKKIRRELNTVMTIECPLCKGRGRVFPKNKETGEDNEFNV